MASERKRQQMKQWVSMHCDVDLERIAKRYHISEIFAEVLIKRKLYTWDAMDSYLFPDIETLYAPEKMQDLVKAAELLEEVINRGETVLVIGDYDVDGIMSSYIFVQGIRLLGGKAEYRIPHRVKDGYGIRDYMVDEAYERGIHTIVTCDNGISAETAVHRAKELGMTFLLTDHHEVPMEDGVEKLPPADAVVDPKQSACEYPCSVLCGAGVAFKLMQYLFGKRGMEKMLSELLPFAAIATVCDVVPLIDENRVIVSNGLRLLADGGQFHNMGLRALIDAIGIEREINSGHLGFQIGPSLNAAGRLGDAALGLKLLLEEQGGKAAEMAAELVSLNEERKAMTEQATRRAICQIEEQNMLALPVLVLYLEDCHESVGGIVAGRIREKYYRPCIVFARGESVLKGSGRSIPNYHMQRALTEVRELLVEFGGHAMAAGCSVRLEQLEAFRAALNEKCKLKPEEMVEKLFFDCEVALRKVTPELVTQLKWMEPIGEGNPKAIFAVRELLVVSCHMCGREMQIARLRVRENENVYDMVDFQAENHVGAAVRARYGREAWEEMKQGVCGKKLDFLYRPEINERYGNIQFVVEDCR